MVGFDAHFVMLALRPAIPASVDRAKDRVLNLLDELQNKGERIVIPTPALTEFLVHAEAAGPRYLDEIQRSIRFKIAPYGVRAAVEVAAAIESAVTKKDKRDGTRDTWAKVNFDRQIAGIAKVEGCHTIYTDDKGVKSFAERLGLKVIQLQEVDLPPSKTPLLDGLDEPNEKAQETKAAENSAGLQADGAGSTGDAAGTSKEEGSKGKA